LLLAGLCRVSQMDIYSPAMYMLLFDIQLYRQHKIANGFSFLSSPFIHSAAADLHLSSLRAYAKVEAFPEPMRYWEKIPDSRLIEQNEFDPKYLIETVHSDM